MRKSSIRYSSFPRTEPPPEFASELVDVFKTHEDAISTIDLQKGLTSDEVLAVLRSDLQSLGFDVEASKRKKDKILRPVFFGENGESTLKCHVLPSFPGA